MLCGWKRQKQKKKRREGRRACDVTKGQKAAIMNNICAACLFVCPVLNRAATLGWPESAGFISG